MRKKTFPDSENLITFTGSFILSDQRENYFPNLNFSHILVNNRRKMKENFTSEFSIMSITECKN